MLVLPGDLTGKAARSTVEETRFLRENGFLDIKIWRCPKMLKQIFVSLFLLFALTTKIHADMGFAPSNATWLDTLSPRIDNIEPNTVLVGENKLITITGKGFSYGIILKIGQWTASNVNVNAEHAKLTATAPSGSKGTFDVVVNNPNGTNYIKDNGFTYKSPLTSISIAPSTATLKAGQTQQFTVNAYDADSQKVVVSNTDVTWEVVGGIGSIDTNGLFTAKKAASGNIKAILKTDSKISATVALNVQAGDAESITVQTSADVLIADGKSQATITATVKDAYDNPVKTETVSMVMNLEKVPNLFKVTVKNNSDGTYTATYTTGIKIGEVEVKATTSNGKSGNVKLTLKPGPASSVQVSANPDKLRADGVSKSTITVTVKDENGNPIEDAQVKMNASQGVITSPAEHQSGGNYTATYTAGKTEGKAIITATASGQSYSVDGRTEITLTKVNLTLEPTYGHIGTMVKVTGAGFGPNSDIGQLTFDGNVIIVADVGAGLVIGRNINSDGSGAFEVVFETPERTGGTAVVAVSGAQANFKIIAQITSLKPEKGSAGAKVELSGNGYAADEDIQIDFGKTAKITKVKSDSEGVFKASFEADVQSLGLKEIKATGVTSQNSATVNFELLKSISESVSVKSNPASLIADGASKSDILITLKDVRGRPVIGETVTVTASAGAVTSQVQDNSDGTYTAKYTSATKSGTVTIKAETPNGKMGETVLTLTAGPAAKVTVKAEPNILPANGKAQSTITATVKDKNDNPVATEKVEMSILIGGGKLEPVVNIGDGTYTAKYTAGTQEGIVTIKATTSNGQSGEANITLKKGALVVEPNSGPVDTTVKVSGSAFEPNTNIGKLSVNKTPIVLLADIGAGIVIAGEIVTDENGAFDVSFVIPKQPGGTLLIEASSGQTMFEITSRIESVTPKNGPAGTQITIVGDGFAFSENITVSFGETKNIAQVKAAADGSFEVAFSADAQESGTKEILVTGSLSKRTAKANFELIIIKSEPATISIEANPKEIVADGVSTSQLTITVKDANGYGVSGQNITVTPSSGKVSSAKYQSDGVYLATYTSDTKAGTVTISASTENGKAAQTQIILTPVPSDVTVDAKPNSLSADGSSQSIITATVKDAYDNLIKTEVVSMTITKGAGSLGNVQNNNDGTYTATYTAGTVQGEVVIQASTQNGKVGTATLILTKPIVEFTISALKTEITATAGGFATYLIKLEGKNGFSAKVTLFVSKLPSKVEATFNPESVTLSKSSPLDTSQLTLHLPDDINPDDYPHSFTVLAVPDAGETRQLTLTVNIEKVKVQVETSLILNLQPPKEVPFMENLNLFGDLVSLSDTQVELSNAKISIIFTAPGGKTQTFESKTTVEGKYQLATPFSPNEVGEWTITAKFEGNAQLKSSERKISFIVTQGRSEIVFDTNTTGGLGTEIEILGRLKPQLEGELLSLKILRPDGKASTLTGLTTKALGVFQHTLKLDIAGDWEITATWSGNKNYKPITGTLVIHVSKEFGKVIIVLGGGNRDDNSAWKTFNQVAEYVHRIFKRRGFDDEEDIRFLSPDPKETEGADDVTSITTLEFAITNWAAKRVNAQVPLYLYLLSHNLEDNFLLEKRGNQETYLTPDTLDSWLDQLTQDTPVTIIIEACHSGNFIQTDEGKSTPLVGPNRTIIVSARGDKQAKVLENRSSFSKEFFDEIIANKTIGIAFKEAEDKMKRIRCHLDQFPEMDADGDGTVNTQRDYAKVIDCYLPADMISLASPPEIVNLTPPQTLPEGVSSLTIHAELLGVGITQVFATVIPPDFDATQRINDWSELDFDEFELVQIDDRKYAGTYRNFIIPGDYTIIVNAENSDGSATPVQTAITAPGAKPKRPWDVNSDGVVDVLDLASVGSQFGQKGVGLSGDVNGDGTVDVFDLALVGLHFGE
jgi:hypothetical protein